MSELRVSAAHHTDKGPHRPRNEDVAFCDVEQGVCVVADGLGGAAAGDRAARIATDIVRAALLHQGSPAQVIDTALPKGESRHVLQGMSPAEDDLSDPAARVRFSFLLAHHGVLAEGRATGCVGMATALVLAWRSGGNWWIGHVGDCRAYVLEGNRLSLLTHDHSLSAALTGRPSVPERGESSPFLRSRLTQVVGGESVPTPDVRRWAPSSGAKLAMCTDGVWGSLAEDEIRAALQGETAPGQSARRLVDTAIRSGSRDNATALVVTF